jgi:hypothetical protein
LSPRGFGALTPKTVIDVFRDTVQKHGSNAALCYKRPVNVRSERGKLAVFNIESYTFLIPGTFAD